MEARAARAQGYRYFKMGDLRTWGGDLHRYYNCLWFFRKGIMAAPVCQPCQLTHTMHFPALYIDSDIIPVKV